MKKIVSMLPHQKDSVENAIDVFDQFIKKRRVESANTSLTHQEKTYLTSRLLGQDIGATITEQTQRLKTRLGDRLFDFDAINTFSSEYEKKLDPATLIIPREIEEQLESSCPFTPGKSVKHTHRLVYFPGLSVQQIKESLKYDLRYNRDILKLRNERYRKDEYTADAHTADRDFYTEVDTPQWGLVYDHLQDGSKDVDYFDYDETLLTPENYHSASSGEAVYFQLVHLLKLKASPFGSDSVGTNDEYLYDRGEPVVSSGISEGSIVVDGYDNNCDKNTIGRMLVYKLKHKSEFWRK